MLEGVLDYPVMEFLQSPNLTSGALPLSVFEPNRGTDVHVWDFHRQVVTSVAEGTFPRHSLADLMAIGIDAVDILTENRHEVRISHFVSQWTRSVLNDFSLSFVGNALTCADAERYYDDYRGLGAHMHLRRYCGATC